MARPGFVFGVLLITGLVALCCFPVPTAQSQRTDQPTSGAADEGPCLAWDISGTWHSKSSGGAVGTETFTLDRAGNVTGTWRNTTTGATGDFIQVEVRGAAIFLRTDTGLDYRATVDPSGTSMLGTFAFDNLQGVWQTSGLAKCLERGAPQVAGSMEVVVGWGGYRFRSTYTPGSSPGEQVIAGRPVASTSMAGANRFSSVGQSTLAIRAETWNQAGDARENLDVWDRVTILHPTDPFERLRKLGTLQQQELTPTGQRFEGQVSVEPFLAYISPDVGEIHEVYVEAPSGVLVPVGTNHMLLLDPMGSVYDAGSDAVIEGAMVLLLQEQDGQWLAWNAAKSGQTNPTVTGTKGGYGWDGLQGEYLARAFNRCFQDAESAKVDVPPSPTGVNIGLMPVGCSGLEISDLWLADGRGLSQGAFQPGQELQHHLVISNTTGADVEVDIAWQVSDPLGERVDELSGSARFVIPPFGADLPLLGRMRGGAPEGQYTLAASLTHQGQTSFGAMPFRVTPPSAVYLPLVQGNDDGGHWCALVVEDFEGEFPGPWVVVDKNNEQDGLYKWDKSACRAASGTYSGWAVGGGTDGEKLDCRDNYPDGAYSWMTFGPFSLKDATSAELRFKRWVNTPGPEDSLQYLASVDNSHYEGFKLFNPTQAWKETVFDLRRVPVLGNLTGQDSVWIRFVFESKNADTRPEGAYIDDIVLSKWVHTKCLESER